MHYACQFGNEFAVKWLWGQGLPTDNLDKLGYSPLMFACQTGNIEIINFLRENGANSERIFQNAKTRQVYQNPTRTMLHFACESGNVEAIKLFPISNVNFLSWDGSPLNIACKKNSIEAADYLLKNGADPKLGSEFNDFPILNAAKNGNLELLKLLVDSGADCNVVGQDSMTSLKLAFFGNFTDCILYLTSIKATTKFLSSPPIILAVINQNYDLMKDLIKVDPNSVIQTDSNGNNIYHFLGYYESVDIMASLLPLKPQDAPNRIGQTPLAYAAMNNKEKSVEFFIKNGSNPNRRDANGFYFFAF